MIIEAGEEVINLSLDYLLDLLFPDLVSGSSAI